ncbi:hypothetical protein Pla163_10910 [Planctomycetes bacterium Pla163]|uniref:Uncharacterized protein n=1 Tax=Rohdeia mirabilis TaxID=2528008 RepID=A0A518CXP1_9BACT|nr:hypothetical protein Pla163_10910 [Planctomycetes bacterium Pla163]
MDNAKRLHPPAGKTLLLGVAGLLAAAAWIALNREDGEPDASRIPAVSVESDSPAPSRGGAGGQTFESPPAGRISLREDATATEDAVDSDTARLNDLWAFEPPAPYGQFVALQTGEQYSLDQFRPIAPDTLASLGGNPADLDALHAILLQVLKKPGMLARHYVGVSTGPTLAFETAREGFASDADRLAALQAIEEDFLERTTDLSRSLESLIEADYASFLDERRYLVFERGTAPPPNPARASMSFGQYISVGKWFVDATYDPSGHNAIMSSFEVLEFERRDRDRGAAAIQKN